MLLFWTFYSSKNPEKLNTSRFPLKYEAVQLFSALITTPITEMLGRKFE